MKENGITVNKGRYPKDEHLGIKVDEISRWLASIGRLDEGYLTPKDVKRELSVVQKIAQTELVRKDVFEAINEWVKPSSITRSGSYGLGSQYDFPLARKPSKRVAEIEDCLSNNYSPLWASLHEFKYKYSEYATGNIPKGFLEKESNESTSIDIDAVNMHKKSMLDNLRDMHDKLVGRFNSEILDKHDTQLKC